MKNCATFCTFAALLSIAASTGGCAAGTQHSTTPATSAIGKTAKTACFEKGGVKSCGKIKTVAATPRFVPVSMGHDAYGMRLFGLPEGHALLARGYVPGEVLASCNGKTFAPERHALLGKVITGDLKGAHLTVLRDGREVTLGSKGPKNPFSHL